MNDSRPWGVGRIVELDRKDYEEMRREMPWGASWESQLGKVVRHKEAGLSRLPAEAVSAYRALRAAYHARAWK